MEKEEEIFVPAMRYLSKREIDGGRFEPERLLKKEDLKSLLFARKKEID